jgi:hypothetical protein
LRKRTIDVLKYLGVKGGALVPHVKPGRPGIHFHAVTLGNLDKHLTPATYKRYGVVVKEIRGAYKVGSLAAYELDHAVRPGGEASKLHTVTYFGVLNSKHLEKKVEEISEISTCRICGAEEREERILSTWDGGSVVDPPHLVHRNVYTFIRRSCEHAPG